MTPRPSTLPRAVVRELDRRAIHECGVPSLLLMENAGRACAEEGARLLADSSKPILVLAGPGNNGGDGFVIARLLARQGRAVRTLFVGPVSKLESAGDDVRVNQARLEAMGQSVLVVEGSEDWGATLRGDEAPALVVDALFGTGLSRPLGEPWLGAISAVEALREEGTRVLAVDLPSGLDADSGQVLGGAVRADLTVTFVAAKPGFWRGEGPAHVGRVKVVPIGIPPHLLEALEDPQREG